VKTDNSKSLFEQAQTYIPGGVNSPVRAFKQVGGTPIFFKSAKGAYLIDEDDNEYIDFINSWGAMILGHAHPQVTAAIAEHLQYSTSFGAPTALEVKMAELIVSMVPNVDMVRMVSSGTEACMTAIRLARGYTGRNKIVKFEGCYHGHSDALLAKAGSGVATLNIQQVPGIPSAVLEDTITLPYNDVNAVTEIFARIGAQIAAVIVEPVAGNMGCVLPVNGFLEVLREQCSSHNSVLIFDEVMTGFRLAKEGAQQLLSIKADLLTFGKVIGGGMPVGAVAGSANIMNYLAPVGNVYQAGTLSGNPVAMIAGYTALRILNDHPEYYEQLKATTLLLANGLRGLADKYRVPIMVNQLGSMISLHFTDKPIHNFADAASADNEQFKKYFHFMLERGVYLPPSPYESWFVSIAITEVEVNKLLNATEEFYQSISNR
jgi:glutamate-1-semialdehyde 2,1-aminomutase